MSYRALIVFIAATHASLAQETPPPTQQAHSSAQHGQDAPPPATAEAVEDEVLGNIRAQAIGPATVADLALPEEFLRRIADRIVRSSYEERYRIVVSDEHAAATGDAAAAAPPDQVLEAPVGAWQVMLWSCLGILAIVFGTLVWRGRQRASA